MIKKCILPAITFLSLTTYGQMAMVSNSNRDSNMVKQLYFAGLKEKMADNYSLAATNFNKIVGLDVNNHAAWFELANANLRMDKLFEAEQNIKQAIKLKPDQSWYYRLLAEVYKRSNKMPELVEVFNQLIRIDPEDDGYYFDKANALLLSNQSTEAKNVYDEIQIKFGDSRELENARRRTQANNNASESDIVKLLEGNQADVKNYLYAAGLLLQKGNDVEALKVLLKAQQIENNNFEINLALADIYRKQKNDAAAFSSLKLAFGNEQMPLTEKIKIVAALFPKMNQPVVAQSLAELGKIIATQNSGDAKALALYGDVLYQQGRFRDALAQYQQALKVNEQVYAVWEQVINIQTLIGHYQEAIKIGDEALTIYPNQASLYYYMAYALFKTGKYDSALNHLNTALQLDVENKSLQAQVYALQGDIYINQNNWSLAKTAFEKAIATEPDNYLIMNNYAYYLALKNDDLSRAETLASAAAHAMPTNSSVTDTYAFILFRQQKYNEAKTWIEKALENNTNKNGVYLEHYGDILFMQGNKDAALVQWQKAKQAGNESEVLNKKINEKRYFK